MFIFTDAMERIESYNSPRDVKFFELIKVHNVKNSEAKSYGFWSECLNVQVGNHVNYSLDAVEPRDNYAAFYFDHQFKHDDIDYHHDRNHYIVKVELYCNDATAEMNDEDKLYEMRYISISKRRYILE